MARHLDISKGAVNRWIEGKGLPAHEVGWRWKFKLADVDERVCSGGASDEASRAEGRE